MTPREKVSAQEFSIQTALSPEAIREAGQRAAEAGKVFMESTVVEHEVTASTISYVITGMGGFVQQMELAVGWEQIGEGQRRVTLAVGDFMTDQMSIWFIPISPKSVTAMRSLKRFATRLREEIS